jgi:hypothetical protein
MSCKTEKAQISVSIPANTAVSEFHLPEKHRSKGGCYSKCCLWQGVLFIGYDICDKRANGGNKPPTIVVALSSAYGCWMKHTIAFDKCLEQQECPINSTPCQSQ